MLWLRETLAAKHELELQLLDVLLDLDLPASRASTSTSTCKSSLFIATDGRALGVAFSLAAIFLDQGSQSLDRLRELGIVHAAESALALDSDDARLAALDFLNAACRSNVHFPSST